MVYFPCPLLWSQYAYDATFLFPVPQVDALQTKFTAEYHAQSFTNFSVAGEVAGLYKNAGTFSYVSWFHILNCSLITGTVPR